jgi:hypothetical protein
VLMLERMSMSKSRKIKRGGCLSGRFDETEWRMEEPLVQNSGWGDLREMI